MRTTVISKTLVRIPPQHEIICSPREDGVCSFANRGLSTVAPWLDVEPHVGQCSQPASWTVIGTSGLTAELCDHHAAHVRACRICRPLVAHVGQWFTSLAYAAQKGWREVAVQAGIMTELPEVTP